jgi:hypothetical protein
VTHLTRDELVAWRDRRPDVDRERVLSHLGGCRPCTAAYAELVRTAPAGEPPVHFRPADFVQRGYAVRRAARQPMWSSALGSWKVWGGTLSAAAALLLIVTLGPVSKPERPEVRGTKIELAAPVAAIGRPVTLEWTSGLRAPKYAVVVTDAAGAEIYRTTTTEPRATVPADASGKLRPGATYSWSVTALDADGQAVTSAAGTFSVSGSSR